MIDVFLIDNRIGQYTILKNHLDLLPRVAFFLWLISTIFDTASTRRSYRASLTPSRRTICATRVDYFSALRHCSLRDSRYFLHSLYHKRYSPNVLILAACTIRPRYVSIAHTAQTVSKLFQKCFRNISTFHVLNIIICNNFARFLQYFF